MHMETARRKHRKVTQYLRRPVNTKKPGKILHDQDREDELVDNLEYELKECRITQEWEDHNNCMYEMQEMMRAECQMLARYDPDTY